MLGLLAFLGCSGPGFLGFSFHFHLILLNSGHIDLLLISDLHAGIGTLLLLPASALMALQCCQSLLLSRCCFLSIFNLLNINLLEII